MPEKMWGEEPFWGLSYDWDPDWVLTDRQKELRETLIGLCEQEMRANAKRSDDELLYPRRNLELMGEHGFLALTVPEEYGGLGENHVAQHLLWPGTQGTNTSPDVHCHFGGPGLAERLLGPEIPARIVEPIPARHS